MRDLKVRAVQERDRLRQVREAISAGQRAMRQGDADVAEREYQRALQLDPANAQATNLLAQIQKDREAREREQRLKEGLNQAENLISGKKFDEAQRKLTELQQAYPDAEEVQQKLQVLNQRRAEAAAPPPPPSRRALRRRGRPRGARRSTRPRSRCNWRRNSAAACETPRAPEPAPPAKPPAPALTPTIPIPQAPAQATQFTEAPQAEPPVRSAWGHNRCCEFPQGAGPGRAEGLEVLPRLHHLRRHPAPAASSSTASRRRPPARGTEETGPRAGATTGNACSAGDGEEKKRRRSRP